MKRPRKVLFVLPSLVMGGTITHALQLMKALQRQGITVIAASSGGIMEAQIKQAGIVHYTLKRKLGKHSIGGLQALLEVFAVKRIVEQEQVDLLHAHQRLPAMVCAWVSRLTRIPWVLTVHGIWKAGKLRNLVTYWPQQVISVGEGISRHLQAGFHLKPESVHLIPNGIDGETFFPDTVNEATLDAWGLRAEAHKIAYVGGMDGAKGRLADLLLEWAEQAPGDVQVVLAGPGGRVEELRRRAQELNARVGARRVIVTGPVLDVASLFHSVDVVFGAGRVALEAMACGRPVLATGRMGWLGRVTPENVKPWLELNYGDFGAEREVALACVESAVGQYLAEAEEERRAQVELLTAFVQERLSLEMMADETLRVYRACMETRS